MIDWPGSQLSKQGLPEGMALNEELGQLLKHSDIVKQNKKNTLQHVHYKSESLLFKLARVPALRFHLRNALPAHRALNSLLFSERLLAKNIPHAKVLAAGYVSGLRFPYQAFSIQQYIQGSVSLWDRAEPDSRLVLAAAEFLAKLHDAGFSHGDAKWANFLLSEQSFLWIDLDGMQGCKLEGDAQARDVARFLIDLLVKEQSDCFNTAVDAYYQARAVNSRPLFSKKINRYFAKFAERHAKQYGRDYLLQSIGKIQ